MAGQDARLICSVGSAHGMERGGGRRKRRRGRKMMMRRRRSMKRRNGKAISDNEPMVGCIRRGRVQSITNFATNFALKVSVTTCPSRPGS
eukprot:5734882-Pyramimonas_sp.AAC.1